MRIQDKAQIEIAVIGTGPSAFAVVSALLGRPDSHRIHVTLVGPDEGRPEFALRGKDPRTWTPDEYDTLHRRLKERGGRGFPPPRTQHGSLLGRCLTDSRTTMYRTNHFGGLGEFWSTSMFPFREHDFRNWPIDYEEMRPYYQRISDLVGIAGETESFGNLYPDTFVNRPAVEQTPLAHRLTGSLGEDRNQDFNLVGGANPLAVETRRDSQNGCEYCGGCFYGCFKGSLFRPGIELKKLIDCGKITWIPASALSVSRQSDGNLVIDLGRSSTGRFEKVFLSAGAIGSSAIILRSLGLVEHDVFISDNEMYNFLILYYGTKRHRFTDHFPISAGAVSMESIGNRSGEHGHLLVAALPSLAFDYYLPKRFADRVRGLIRFLQERILLGQMYVDGVTAARYAMRVDREGTPSVRNVRSGESDASARRQVDALGRSLKGSGFIPLTRPLMRVSSSYHYTGGFPFGNDMVPMDEKCELLPGLYACDSVVFPDSPAQPLTFTIMANAMRVATLAMG